MNRARVWEAINEYVRACGGDPAARAYGNTLRQNAVVDIESEIAHAESGMSERELRLEIELEEHANDLDAIRDVLYEQFSKGKCSELVAVGLIEKIIRESPKGSRLTEEMRRSHTLYDALRRLNAMNRGNADEHEPGCMCAVHEADAAIALCERAPGFLSSAGTGEPR